MRATIALIELYNETFRLFSIMTSLPNRREWSCEILNPRSRCSGTRWKHCRQRALRTFTMTVLRARTC